MYIRFFFLLGRVKLALRSVLDVVFHLPPIIFDSTILGGENQRRALSCYPEIKIKLFIIGNWTYNFAFTFHTGVAQQRKR